MDKAAPDATTLLARWQLEEVDVREVVQAATEALEAGCDTPTLRIVAGITTAQRAEVEQLLPRLLRELDLDRPGDDEAVKVLVDDVARRIAGGRLPPAQGAAQLWLRAHHFEGNQAVWSQLRPFIALASELEDWPEGRAQTEADIVKEAVALIERGGLQLRC